MIDYLRSTHYRPSIKKRIELQPGSWVRCEKPNDAEKDRLIELGVDRDILLDALDPHEIPRVDNACFIFAWSAVYYYCKS